MVQPVGLVVYYNYLNKKKIISMTSWMEMLSKVIWFYIVVIQPQHLPQFDEVMRGGQLLNDFFFFFKLYSCLSKN